MYRSALLMALVECGLVEGLVNLGKEQLEKQHQVQNQEGVSENQKLWFKATVFLGGLLKMSSFLLPRLHAARLQVRNCHS